MTGEMRAEARIGKRRSLGFMDLMFEFEIMDLNLGVDPGAAMGSGGSRLRWVWREWRSWVDSRNFLGSIWNYLKVRVRVWVVTRSSLHGLCKTLHFAGISRGFWGFSWR
jgi:hypothetical protein